VKTLLEEGADPNRETSKHGDAIRSVLEGQTAFQVLRHKKLHPMKDVALRLPQHQIYEVLDWVEETEKSRQPRKASESSVKYDAYTEFSFSTVCTLVEDLNRSSQLIQILFDHGANSDSKTGLLGNHLHLASFLGMEDWAHRFVEMGMDVNDNSGYFETPLLAALLGEQYSIAKFLIESGADVSHKSDQHGTALYIACSKSGTFSRMRWKDVSKLLLDYGAKIDREKDGARNPLSAVLEASTRISSSDPADSDLMLEMLLSQFKNLQITAKKVIQAVKRDLGCWEKRLYVELVFEYGQSLTTPEAAILIPLSSYREHKERLIKLLLTRVQTGTITEDMLKATPGIDLLHPLLQHPHTCRITLALLKDAVTRTDSLERLAMFLNHDVKLRVDGAIVAAASKLISADALKKQVEAF
jgi:hypothetical protein